MLKVAVILLVVLVVLLVLPLGMPMSGASMCPDCGDIGASWGLMCVALLGSIVVLVRRRAMATLVDLARRPLFVAAGVLERPPRPS